jgi:predicted aspartyl protease
LFSFDRIRIFAGNAQGDTPFAEWSLDEIRIGETFSDVTPHIPEPAALSLGLLGLAALSTQRRRR